MQFKCDSRTMWVAWIFVICLIAASYILNPNGQSNITLKNIKSAKYTEYNITKRMDKKKYNITKRMDKKNELLNKLKELDIRMTDLENKINFVGTHAIDTDTKTDRNVINYTMYQTWGTTNYTQNRHWEIITFKKFNPNWKYHLFSDTNKYNETMNGWLSIMTSTYSLNEFTKIEIDKINCSFSLITKNAGKADLWRYLIIHQNGGFYTDFDTAKYATNMSQLIDIYDELVISITPKKHTRDQFTTEINQWAFGAKQYNPILKNIINNSVETILEYCTKNRNWKPDWKQYPLYDLKANDWRFNMNLSNFNRDSILYENANLLYNHLKLTTHDIKTCKNQYAPSNSDHLIWCFTGPGAMHYGVWDFLSKNSKDTLENVKNIRLYLNVFDHGKIDHSNSAHYSNEQRDHDRERAQSQRWAGYDAINCNNPCWKHFY